MNETPNDKKPKTRTPPSLANPDNRSPSIAVRLANFIGAVNIPGDSAADKVRCEKPAHPGIRHWTCDLIPALRAFEITYYDSNDRPAERVYVNESHVKTWYPL